MAAEEIEFLFNLWVAPIVLMDHPIKVPEGPPPKSQLRVRRHWIACEIGHNARWAAEGEGMPGSGERTASGMSMSTVL